MSDLLLPPSLSDMTPETTCCFTGHRQIPSGLHDDVVRQTEHAVRLLIRTGYRCFLCGGALGYDMLAGQVVIRAAASHPEVRLVLALPCRDQTEKWLRAPGVSVDVLREYQRLKSEAFCVLYITDFYRDGCMKERNQFMVDHSSFCVAYYNGVPRSGTGQTFRMAERAGLRIYNVYSVLSGFTGSTGGEENGSSDSLQ